MISTMQTERTGVEVHAAGSSYVRWSAIFAGWLIGNAIMLLMMNFGSAIGLSAVDVTNPETAAKGLAAGTLAWALVTWAVSFYLAGHFAAWLSGIGDRMAGMLHGLAVWSLAVAFTVFIGALGAAGALKAGAAIGQGAVAAGQAASQSGAADEAGQNPLVSSVTGNLQDRLKDGIAGALAAASPAMSAEDARTTADQIDQETLTAVGSRIAAGDTEGAKQALAGATTLTPAQVDRVVADVSSRAREGAREAATTAKTVSAGTLWLVFFSGLFGLVFSVLGGAFGARRLARGEVRRYERA